MQSTKVSMRGLLQKRMILFVVKNLSTKDDSRWRFVAVIKRQPVQYIEYEKQ